MNYRHIYHAGNFADVFKHVFLARMLAYLIRKPTPLHYLDTHAGIGSYDLGRPEAERTGEWRTGIGRLPSEPAAPEVQALLVPYLTAVGPCDAAGRPLRYPGSPAVAQAILRPTDRLTLSERHPDDVAILRKAMRGDKRVTILADDGYRVLNASIPPPERRGLVLIDPPFEERDEADRLVDGLRLALRKWATGIFAVWYPIKDAPAASHLRRKLASLSAPHHCTLEIVRDAGGGPALRGCGLFVVNPPYVLAEEAETILPYLCCVLNDPRLPPFRGHIEHHEDAPAS